MLRKTNEARGLFLLGPRTIARLPESSQCGTGMRTDIQIIGQNKGPEISPYIYSQWISTKTSRPFSGEKTASSANSAGTWQLPTRKRMKSNPLSQGSPVPGCRAGGQQQESKRSSTYCTPWLQPPPGPHLTLPRRNCPPRNQSLVPKWLGTTALHPSMYKN